MDPKHNLLFDLCEINYLLLDEEVVYNVPACVEVLLGFPGQLLVSFKLDLVPGLLINHTHTLN